MLRGGSWNNENENNARCAFRNRNPPNNRNNNRGCRVAFSHTFLSVCHAGNITGRRVSLWANQGGCVVEASRGKLGIKKWRGLSAEPQFPFKIIPGGRLAGVGHFLMLPHRANRKEPRLLW